MIDPNDPKITILRQCALVSISRSTFRRLKPPAVRGPVYTAT
jgi:hypothetical protein